MQMTMKITMKIKNESYPNRNQTQMGMTLMARHRRAYVLESFISTSLCDAQIGLS